MLLFLVLLFLPSIGLANETNLRFRGFVDGQYAVDWGLPSTNDNRARLPHRAYDLSEGASLSLAGIDILVGSDDFGIEVDLRGGMGARRLLGFDHQDNLAFVGVSQAYGYWQSGSFVLDVGLFGHIFGLESPDQSWLNWQYTLSASRVLFQPRQHIGIRGSWVVHEKVGLTILLDNGGALTLDGNAHPSFGIQMYAQLPLADLYLGYYGGPTEPNARFEEFAHLFEAMLDIRTGQVALQGSFDYGITSPHAREANAEYAALSAVLGMEMNEQWRASGRFEYVLDSRRALTRLYKELLIGTLTLDYQALAQLIVRVEVRAESTPERIYGSSDDDSSTWLASTLNAVFYFGYQPDRI